jgi:hypothetical protein
MMDALYLWPDNPGLSILVLIVAAVIFMYFAREPIQRVLKTLAQGLSGGLRQVAGWCDETADRLQSRSRELLLEAGRDTQEKHIEQEFTRLESSYARDLAEYPRLHLKLDENITRIDSDYREAAEVPPAAPGWGEVVEAITKVKGMNTAAVESLLDDIHDSAVEAEKEALQQYRAASAKRHKILASMAPHWKELKGVLDRVGKSVNTLLESTRRIDGYMDRYEQIQSGDDRTVRNLASSAGKLFIISLIVIGIAVAAAFINFQLIALPMSELVPSGTRLVGMPVASVAALVIVLMEVAAGIFLLDALGITHLFPQIGTLPASRRRLVLSVALGSLFLLASIEASLAVLREQLVEAEMSLMESLAGVSQGAVARATGSLIPVVGQAVLGFTLPWILAMIAVPLEMLIESGRHVVNRCVVLLLKGFGLAARSLAFVLLYAVLLIAHLYDAIIMIPIQVERWVRGDEATSRPALTAEDMLQGFAFAPKPSSRPANSRGAAKASASASRRTARKTSAKKKKSSSGGAKQSNATAASKDAAPATAAGGDSSETDTPSRELAAREEGP